MSDPRAALEAIGQLPDGEIEIAEAALHLARVDAPGEPWRPALAHLADIAQDAVSAARDVSRGDMRAQAAVLAGVLAGRHAYLGDVDTYDDPANANLIRVIQRRRGLPVALGILWLHAARACGWPAHGIDFPGHFLVALGSPREPVVLDVFTGGGIVEPADLRRLRQALAGADADVTAPMLAPMSQRAVLLRLQNNLRQRRLLASDLAGALACAQDMLRIAPEEAWLWRDTALLHQRLHQMAAALTCLERFVALVPEGEAADRARAAMADLRARLN